MYLSLYLKAKKIKFAVKLTYDTSACRSTPIWYVCTSYAWNKACATRTQWRYPDYGCSAGCAPKLAGTSNHENYHVKAGRRLLLWVLCTSRLRKKYSTLIEGFQLPFNNCRWRVTVNEHYSATVRAPSALFYRRIDIEAHMPVKNGCSQRHCHAPSSLVTSFPLSQSQEPPIEFSSATGYSGKQPPQSSCFRCFPSSSSAFPS